jgi:hypothetical protein
MTLFRSSNRRKVENLTYVWYYIHHNIKHTLDWGTSLNKVQLNKILFCWQDWRRYVINVVFASCLFVFIFICVPLFIPSTIFDITKLCSHLNVAWIMFGCIKSIMWSQFHILTHDQLSSFLNYSIETFHHFYFHLRGS